MKIEKIIKLMDYDEEIFIQDYKTFKVYHDGIVKNIPNELKNLSIKELSAGNNIIITYVVGEK